VRAVGVLIESLLNRRGDQIAEQAAA